MLLGTPRAWAADDFIKGVYLQSEELCAQAKKTALQTVIEAGNMVLTASGLEAIEYNCEFLQIYQSDARARVVGRRICQVPGQICFPTFSRSREMNPTQIDLVSVKLADPDGVGGNSGSYYLCDGVAVP